MKVAPAVAEVLGVVDDAAGRTEGYGEVLSVAHAPPAAEPAAPRPAEMERGPAAADEVQPGAGGAHGFVEFLGRWNEKEHDRAMPVKFKIWGRGTYIRGLRVAFSRFVDELVQEKVPSGIFVISQLPELRWTDGTSPEYGFSWSASPDDVSYQRHGFVGMESTQRENIRFADFEGVVDAFGALGQIAVYRVTLPRGGLDPDKWAGRPPLPAPADLYTGPRSDGLRSTEDISGKYFSSCFPYFCSSITVTPLGADMIEMKKRGVSNWKGEKGEALPCPCMPICANDIKTRVPGTNVFSLSEMRWYQHAGVQGHQLSAAVGKEGTVFNDDGSMENDVDKCVTEDGKLLCCGHGGVYRRSSKGRPFRRVETKDIAGTWCHCRMYPTVYMMLPFLFPPLALFPPLGPWLFFSTIACSTKKRLNEDQYEEKGCCCCSLPPLSCPFCETRTRKYVNGHPTNVFTLDGQSCQDWRKYDDWYFDVWYRDSGCVDGARMDSPYMPTISLDYGWKCCPLSC